MMSDYDYTYTLEEVNLEIKKIEDSLPFDPTERDVGPRYWALKGYKNKLEQGTPVDLQQVIRQQGETICELQAKIGELTAKAKRARVMEDKECRQHYANCTDELCERCEAAVADGYVYACSDCHDPIRPQVDLVFCAEDQPICLECHEIREAEKSGE